MAMGGGAALAAIRRFSSLSSHQFNLHHCRSQISPKIFPWRRFSSMAASELETVQGVISPSCIRNVAVIAHVDHGKTTLMDRLLKQCGASLLHERTLDSISLERERGITIASKYTSMSWRNAELNMVDTPGHADFGGEVERVIGMVEGAVLVVDAGEGPLAQTKFVVGKALKVGIRPILLLNKVDRSSVTEARCGEVSSMVFDLFANLGATDEQLEFPVLYASAKEGWASTTYTKCPAEGEEKSMAPLLDVILQHVSPPSNDINSPFQMLVSMMEHDPYFGRILTGRVYSGIVRIGDTVHALRMKDSNTEAFGQARVVKLMKRKGTSTALIDCAGAGDIISVAGLSQPSIGSTVASIEITTALPSVQMDPPTICMTFGVNDSPLGGRDGTQLTGPKIGERLMAEAESNLSINVVISSGKESYEVQGRGELQLGILVENMRREGFELSVSPPAVMYKYEDGVRLEPIEEVIIEVNDEHSGIIVEGLSHRKGELVDMAPCPEAKGRTKLTFTCPSRGLVGYRSVFNTDTHGTGFLHRSFLNYEKHRGPLGNVRKGVLVSTAAGQITTYALLSLEPRGILFVKAGMEAYEGMIVGEHTRESDLEVNPVRTKQLTNIRSAAKEDLVRLTPPRLVSLEEAIGYVASDELIEVTPKAIRLRKKILDSNKRKGVRRTNKD